jgi:four helix bundle protein
VKGAKVSLNGQVLSRTYGLAEGHSARRAGLPNHESFSKGRNIRFTSQIRRCAVSIPSNIAEGAGRLNTPEYKQILGIARGSHFELQTQLMIAKELGFGDTEQITIARDYLKK